MTESSEASQAPCPTPKKSRFATPEGAEAAAEHASRVLNKRLFPYPCACGWLHLSSKTALKNPDVGSRTAEEILQMDRRTFEMIVREDIRGSLDEKTAAALRDPTVLLRWMTALEDMRSTVIMQLDTRRGQSGDAVEKWREKASVFRDVLGRRHRECRMLFAEASPTGRGLAPKNAEAAMRSWAGEKAIQRLIDHHQREFTEYLVEECEKLGIGVPARVLRYQEMWRAGQENEGEGETGA